MFTLKIQTCTTEYDTYSPEENEFTQFEINDRSMSIKSQNADGEMLTETEISFEDAVKLANLILTLNKS